MSRLGAIKPPSTSSTLPVRKLPAERGEVDRGGGDVGRIPESVQGCVLLQRVAHLVIACDHLKCRGEDGARSYAIDTDAGT